MIGVQVAAFERSNQGRDLRKTPLGGYLSPYVHSDWVTWQEAWASALEAEAEPIGTIFLFSTEDFQGRPLTSMQIKSDNGWLTCNGRMLQRAEYPQLFAQIGDTYGSCDDGFALPDDRAAVWKSGIAEEAELRGIECPPDPETVDKQLADEPPSS